MIFFIIFTICIVGENILRESVFSCGTKLSFLTKILVIFFLVLNRKVRLFLAILTLSISLVVQLKLASVKLEAKITIVHRINKQIHLI